MFDIIHKQVDYNNIVVSIDVFVRTDYQRIQETEGGRERSSCRT